MLKIEFKIVGRVDVILLVKRQDWNEPVDEVEVIDFSADAFRLHAQLNLFLLNQFGDKLDRIKRDAYIN